MYVKITQMRKYLREVRSSGLLAGGRQHTSKNGSMFSVAGMTEPVNSKGELPDSVFNCQSKTDSSEQVFELKLLLLSLRARKQAQ